MTLYELAVLGSCAVIVLLGLTQLVGEFIDALIRWINRHA